MKDTRKVVVWFALATIVLTLILFAIPGSFAVIIPEANIPEVRGAMGGYQFIFGGSEYYRTVLNDGNAMLSSIGIAFLALLVVAVVCYVFHKKSSALLLLAALVMLVDTIMLFCVKSWIVKVYVHYSGSCVGSWVPYLCASLLALATIATFYIAIVSLIKESRQPYTPKKETYSYLKNK